MSMKDKNRIIVIGGGPAGMAAAINAAKRGKKVTLLEKNEKLGKKLYITGKGRCNLTNDCDEEEFLKALCSDHYFMYSSIYSYNSRYVMDFFENLGVALKVERGKRVFPLSEKASDITKALAKEMQRLGVKVELNRRVNAIQINDGKVTAVHADKLIMEAAAVIVATGGLSYSSTGSTGDGYSFAKKAGHELKETFPSLVPLRSDEGFITGLAGLSLKNVALSLCVSGKKVFSDFGEMLFTHTGISGPIVLSASRHYVEGHTEVIIDLKPALEPFELDKRILKDFEESKNKRFKNALDALLPSKIIPVVIEKSAINPEKKVNEVTKAERERLLKTIKEFNVKINGTEGYSQAVITAGGVDTGQINPSTMESKLVKGLYFAGEVLDVDAPTGGFNLQIAFATGFLAGEHVCSRTI